jgi:hypothetical protein
MTLVELRGTSANEPVLRARSSAVVEQKTVQLVGFQPDLSGG